jgi:hypothetical protein
VKAWMSALVSAALDTVRGDVPVPGAGGPAATGEVPKSQQSSMECLELGVAGVDELGVAAGDGGGAILYGPWDIQLCDGDEGDVCSVMEKTTALRFVR